MKIAQIANVVERIPPRRYGGTERVVHALTEGLVKRGHEVTLFASGDSVTAANLISVVSKALRDNKATKELYGLNNFTLLNIGLAYQLQKRFDIIHDHTAPVSFPAANIAQTPVVLTMHGPFNRDNMPMFGTFNKPHVVTISNSQMPRNLPSLNWAGTVYNGLEMRDYPFSVENDGYLLFVGRISIEKGVHLAIEAAKRLNLPLIIAAKLEVTSKADVEYFEKYVRGELNDKIKWIGEVDEKTRNKLMSKALCFLHPVTWAEPFGLTLIEAMACGCPVVAIGKGSIPEIIANGITGYVVKDLEEMMAAILNIENINRLVCRSYSIKNFDASRMVEGYEAIYERILSQESSKLKREKRVIFDFAFANDLHLEKQKEKKF